MVARSSPPLNNGTETMAPRKRSKRPATIKDLSVSTPGNITAQNLARLKGLSELSAGKLEVLAERIAVRRFRKRSAIYREDHVGEGMYIMLSGIARLTCLQQERRTNPFGSTGALRCCRYSLITPRCPSQYSFRGVHGLPTRTDQPQRTG